MALTNDKPRTASIFGLTDLKLLSLSKANFKVFKANNISKLVKREWKLYNKK